MKSEGPHDEVFPEGLKGVQYGTENNKAPLVWNMIKLTYSIALHPFSEPRMRAPRLRGQEAEADEDGVVEVEMSVFWDLGSSRDLASLVGASGRVEALRQLGYDEREVQDLLKIEPYIGSPDQDPDQAAPARGDDGEDDGSNPARRLATAASNLAKTMTECYSSSGGSGALRRSLLVFGEREAFDEVWKHV